MTSDHGPVESALEALLAQDVRFGYLDRRVPAPRHHNPQVVVNTPENSMLRVLREELSRASHFSFSVAFVTPRAIALLKQELVDFEGTGTIVTSDYLGFNSPEAFAELANLARLGIETRIHGAAGYHPKGYVFDYPEQVTAVLGSSNLTENALVRNHEWNLRVSATKRSDLARQLTIAVEDQRRGSQPISDEWIEAYERRYRELRTIRRQTPDVVAVETPSAASIEPNAMQRDALTQLSALRDSGEKRALVISATGTGKTILSALDVRSAAPTRFLYVAHREQILDRAIEEYKHVLGEDDSAFGKVAGSVRQGDRKYVFATIQTLSRPGVLDQIGAKDLEYVLIDEVHRAGADSYLALLNEIEPNFLLGMTATPERTDGFSVFELFDFNVAYEIRLGAALDEDMLCPFHYYGVADATFEDGTTADVDSGLDRLVSQLRVEHLVSTLETYAQAGVPPAGLIFCSRLDEASRLSQELNQRDFRGRRLRTAALSGADNVEQREAAIGKLEAGELDYILTVDVFNEGVDIPKVNQIVMLRQTQSSIVFVQQLGRGLRRAPGKEHVVVIDFIGNYANNFLIPIALFGDDSLDKESIRKNLLAAEESGVLAGLSSVRFDRVSQARVLRSLASTKLDSAANLRSAIETLRSRLGRVPRLVDFLRFESVDPVLLGTAAENYPALLERLVKHESGLSRADSEALALLTHEGLAAKRPHELMAIRQLLDDGQMTFAEYRGQLAAAGASADQPHAESAARVLALEFSTATERERYGKPLVQVDAASISIDRDFARRYRDSPALKSAVDDVIDTGLKVIADRYDVSVPFTPGRQYTRKDASRLLCWARNMQGTIFGYKVDRATATCPVFVTYHKAADVSASTAYADELIDRSTMNWFTRSKRTLASKEVAAIVNREVQVFVFAKKDDAEGMGFYYLGTAEPSDSEQTTMPGDGGRPLDVVKMRLNFDSPIDTAVYDYFHPVVMDE